MSTSSVTTLHTLDHVIDPQLLAAVTGGARHPGNTPLSDDPPNPLGVRELNPLPPARDAYGRCFNRTVRGARTKIGGIIRAMRDCAKWQKPSTPGIVPGMQP